jgi:Phosphopantetheine attachment site.
VDSLECIRERVTHIIEQYTDREIISGEDISLIDDLELDSVQLIEVLTDLEKEFDISFGENEIILDMIDHLEELICYIHNQFM